MQKTDHLRALTRAKASAAPNQTLARLKARSFGKPAPVTNARAAAQHKPRQKPLVW